MSVSNVAVMPEQSAVGKHAARGSRAKRDWRIHLSTAHIWAIVAVVTVFIFMISLTQAWGERMDRLAEIADSDIFAENSYSTIDGRQYTPADLKNARVTLFNVWATNCPPCIEELPALEELNHSYPAGQVQVIGILSDSVDSKGNVSEKHITDAVDIAGKAGVTFPTIVVDKNLYAFVQTTIIGTPTTYVVDSEGHIITTVTGGKKLDGWKEEVDSALASLE